MKYLLQVVKDIPHWGDMLFKRQALFPLKINYTSIFNVHYFACPGASILFRLLPLKQFIQFIQTPNTYADNCL